MNDNMEQDLLAGFVAEMRAHVGRIAVHLQAATAAGLAPERLAGVRSAAHSVKGAASMAGFAALSHAAFLLESTIDEIRAGDLGWSTASADFAVSSADALSGMLDRIGAGHFDCRHALTSCIRAHRQLHGAPAAGIDSEVDSILGTQVEAAMNAAVEEEEEAIPAEVLQVFWQEMDELLRNTSESLLQFERSPGDRQALLEARRAVHTMKGSAASMGFPDCSKLAHRMEDVFDAIREGAIPFDAQASNLLFTCFDALTETAANPEDLSVPKRALAEVDSRFAEVLRKAADAKPRAKAKEEPAEDLPLDLWEAFRAEAEEQVQQIAADLKQLEGAPGNKDLILGIRRSVHTLKGASNMIGRRAMAELAHSAEDLLECCHKDATEWSAEIAELVAKTCDLMLEMSAERAESSAMAGRGKALQAEIAVRTPQIEEVTRKEADRVETPASVPMAEQQSGAPLVAKPVQTQETESSGGGNKATHFVRVPIEKLDELVRLVGELLVNRSSMEQWRNGYARSVDELGLSNTRLHRVSSRLDFEYEVSALGNGMGQLAIRGLINATSEQRKEFDDLEFDRYTDFHLFSRDLSELSSDVNSATGDLRQRVSDFDTRTHRMGRLLSELQDKLMRMRMVPLATLAHRMQRTVRVTAEKRGKQADLYLIGSEVELDRLVMEEMIGPIEHVLRNAVDHGLETPAVRRGKGKAERGAVTVRGYYEGTSVVIEISDDGAGMNLEKIRSTAVKLGYCTEAQASQLSAQQLYPLIFEPGFSTASGVSDVSGRGVGMDVVRNTVNRLKGEIKVDSRAGTGTKFTIRLPMTLAITRVVLLRSHGQLFAIPMATIHRIFAIDPRQVEVLGSQRVIRMQQRVVPLHRLCDVLGAKGAAEPVQQEIPVIILQLGDQQVALTADQLVEAREVVVKTLGDVLKRVHGITGATLTGDGKVVLILNPAELFAEAAESERKPLPSGQGRRSNSRGFDVMIVDDSVSVRRLLTNLIARQGWKATTAKDGMEALEMLQRGTKRPDVILLDIEMPRMDGYELTTVLRSQEAFRDIPIIMCTSRAGDKHRKKAFDLGANDYLVKPYQDDELLEAVRKAAVGRQEAPVS
ncbi:MAG: Hpt domain-containing protein [Bryobacterales bacterium]|nr:Hpt domain-containing protein [Bryobacterales bacterium]